MTIQSFREMMSHMISWQVRMIWIGSDEVLDRYRQRYLVSLKIVLVRQV